MKREILILPLITILVTSILYFLPVQTIRVTGANILGELNGHKIDIAVGPDPKETTSGFNVTENDSYTYVLTAYEYPEYIGAKIRYSITEINNSWEFWDVLIFWTINWTADYIFGTFEFYDITQGKWVDGSTQSETTFDEYILAGYNSTCPYEFESESYYYCLLPGVDWSYSLSDFDLPVKIPHNFAAVNYSIVDNWVYFLKVSATGPQFTNVSFSTPIPGSIAGTWSIWSDDDGRLNYRIIYTYNSEGTLTQFAFQKGIKGGKWIDQERWVLEEGDDTLLLILLSLITMAGGGIWTTETLTIAYVAGGFFVFLIIVAVAKSKG